MKAYVELVQRKERELGTDVLTHQRVRPSAAYRPSNLLTLHNSGVEQTTQTTSSRP
jgi:isocitrate lyase